MLYTLAIAGLATMATAAPMMVTDAKREPDMKMAEDINYTAYPSYKPYAYYDSYASTVNEAGAKTGMAKRQPGINMAEDINYTEYPSYKPYTTYGPYASAIDEASAKQGMAKRHEMMIDDFMMAKDNLKHDTENIACNVKRDNPDGVVACWKRNEMQSPETGKTDTKYGSYDPYKNYGVYKGYAASVDAEGAKANENKE